MNELLGAVLVIGGALFLAQFGTHVLWGLCKVVLSIACMVLLLQLFW